MGNQNDSRITSSYATGQVQVNGDGSKDNHVGGLVGRQENNSRITSSYATGEINGGSGNDSVGGFIGFLFCQNNIINSYATGQVNSDQGRNKIGGFVGNAYYRNPVIINCYSTGQVIGSYFKVGYQHYGSFIGDGSAITNSYGFGTVMFTGGQEYRRPYTTYRRYICFTVNI